VRLSCRPSSNGTVSCSNTSVTAPTTSASTCGSRKPDHRGIPRKIKSLGGAR
jgi:hypothetical protein